MSFEVVAQYPKWGIVDKAAGVSCHNKTGIDLQSLLSEKFKCNIHLVNRLDQETSGLLIYACNPAQVAQLQQALQSPQTQKNYRAVLRGKLDLNEDWTWPLTDKAEGRRDPQGVSSLRKTCLTRVQKIQTNSYFSLVECQLGSGRQHQIRKHAALSKHSIVGDQRYGDPRYNRKIQSLYGTDRLFLHCQKIMLHLNDTEIVAESPTPSEFTRLLA